MTRSSSPTNTPTHTSCLDTLEEGEGALPTSVLDRFKRARTTSPDTDVGSARSVTPDAEYKSGTAVPARATDKDDMPGSSAMRSSDECVNALMDESLSLDDARVPHTTLVREVETWRASQPRIGDTWYVIPADWYERWKVKPQGIAAMNLEALCTNDNGNVTARYRPLRQDLVEHADYELVPAQAWDILASRYRIHGPALGRSVVPGQAPGQARIELFPPCIELAVCGESPEVEPFRSAAASIASSTSLLPTVRLSSGVSLRTLKAHVRAMHLCPRHEDAHVRFFRLPPSLKLTALTEHGMLSKQALAKADPPIELVEGTDDATLASLDLTAPSVFLGIDVRVRTASDPRSFTWQVSTTTSDTGTTDALPTSHTSSRTAITPAPAFLPSLAPPAQHGSTARPCGLRGLANLGNTCFMNSALQCLSNTHELQQYFLNGVQMDELNTDNPLGMGGTLAMAYGRLVSALWSESASGAVVPREFKTTLARFAPQFMGYAQQDSQELLAFLLDGLHEDLNRIHKKPYIEAPDWIGGSDADMVRFAQQQWDLYKARNDSVIVDLFQGQYRSTLVCPTCHKVSVKFDPFMYLTLPIPNTRKWRGRVYVVPQHAAQPLVQVDVQLPATATVAELRTKVADLLSMDPACLLMGEVWSYHVYRWLEAFEPVSEISASDYIYLWEVADAITMPKPMKPTTSRFSFFSRPERTVADIEAAYPPPSDMPATICLPVYSCKADGPDRFGSFRRSLGEPFGLPFFVSIPREKAHDVAWIYAQVLEQYVRFSPEASATDLCAKAADAKRATDARTSADPSTSPDAVPPHTSASVVECAAPPAFPFALRFSVPSADEAMHRGDDANDQTTECMTQRAARLGCPPNSDEASHAAWPVTYPGGALYALWEGAVADAVLEQVRANQTWGPISLAQDADFQKGTAMLAEGKRRAPKLRLDDCLDEFTRAEQLGENDLWYCPACRDFRQATKKFDLWKVPDILVVHLKRFSAGRGTRDKLDNWIEFPLEHLDLRDRVVGTRLWHSLRMERAPSQMQLKEGLVVSHDTHDDDVLADEPVYDLYAVDNHFGGLGGGHYTAFAKNPADGHWYNFDDSCVRPVSDPDMVKSSAAYLLFYRRRTTRPIGSTSRDRLMEKQQQQALATASTAASCTDTASPGRPGPPGSPAPVAPPFLPAATSPSLPVSSAPWPPSPTMSSSSSSSTSSPTSPISSSTDTKVPLNTDETHVAPDLDDDPSP